MGDGNYVWRLMENSMSNFHFVFRNPSLISKHRNSLGERTWKWRDVLWYKRMKRILSRIPNCENSQVTKASSNFQVSVISEEALLLLMRRVMKYFAWIFFLEISSLYRRVLRWDGFQQLVCQPLYSLAGINISREWEQLLAKMSQQFLLRNSQFYMSKALTLIHVYT